MEMRLKVKVTLLSFAFDVALVRSFARSLWPSPLFFFFFFFFFFFVVPPIFFSSFFSFFLFFEIFVVAAEPRDQKTISTLKAPSCTRRGQNPNGLS